MKQVVFIIALYVLINILSLLFYIFSFSSDGKIDIGLPFIFIHLTSAKYDSTFLQVPKRSAIKECPSPRDADVLDA